MLEYVPVFALQWGLLPGVCVHTYYWGLFVTWLPSEIWKIYVMHWEQLTFLKGGKNTKAPKKSKQGNPFKK